MTSKAVRAIEIDGALYQKMPDGSFVPLKGKTDRERLRAMSEDQIEASAAADPDAASVMSSEWLRSAKVEVPTGKTPVTMRLDDDVLAWLKSQKGAYQTRVNAMLRKWMETEKSR